MNDLHEAAVAYIRHVLTETGMSARELAVKSGLSPSTLTRPLNKKDHRFAISTQTLSKIYKATGISPASFMGNISSVELRTYDHADDLTISRLSKEKKYPTRILGEVDPGAWKDKMLFVDRFYGGIPLVHHLLPADDVFAVTVKGNSVNSFAVEGDILFCTKISEHHRIASGQLYILEIDSSDGRLTEMSARVAHFLGDGWILRFASSDMRYDEIIELDENGARPGIRFVGFVNYVVRPLVPW